MSSHAELCPVCHGTGKEQQRDWSTSSNASVWEYCHGCHGLGWVTVGVDYDFVSNWQANAIGELNKQEVK